jgi:3-hydroxyisobutyrate dehydrogenase-like beta-hydroxyacid dehydrogenase
MGLPIARNLLNKGFTVVAYDINRSKVEEIAAFGAEPASDPKEVAARTDVIMTILGYPDIVEQVIDGAEGILVGLRKGSIVIECSSIDHETSIRVGKRVVEAGGRFVEVAILGRPHRIDTQQLVFLAAGEESTVGECEPILMATGRKVLYVGGHGTAKLLKIANAMANATEITILCEVAAWSKTNGIPIDALLEVLQIRSEEFSSRLGQLRSISEGRLKREITWMAKDVHHGSKIAGEKGIAMPVVAAVNTVINLAQERNADGYSFFEMIWNFYNANRM